MLQRGSLVGFELNVTCKCVRNEPFQETKFQDWNKNWFCIDAALLAQPAMNTSMEPCTVFEYIPFPRRIAGLQLLGRRLGRGGG